MSKKDQIKAYRATIQHLASIYSDQGGIFCPKVAPTIQRIFTKIDALKYPKGTK